MNEKSVAKIRCEKLWKVFGPDPKRVVEKWDSLGSGMNKTDLLKKTGCVVAVRDASFSIIEGEIFVLMGLSGSGKSTLLRCINLLHEPTHGNVFIDEEEITTLSIKALREMRRKKTGMVFQNFGLLPHRKVLENVGFALEIQNIDKTKRESSAMQAIEMVGLKGWENYYPNQLSGGMQQRVGLARALATDPELLLMDEAFSALDPLIRREMQDEFVKLLKTMRKTIIFVTHDLQEALKLADHLAVMKDGAIVQMGTPAEVVLHPESGYVAAFVKDLPKMKFLTAASIMMDPNKWLVKADEKVSEILKKMGRENIWHAYIAGEDGRFQGIVDYHSLTNDSLVDKPPNNRCVLHEFPTVRKDIFLEDIIPIASKTWFPIAVTDQQNRVVGIVTRERLLEAISVQESTVGEGDDIP